MVGRQLTHWVPGERAVNGEGRRPDRPEGPFGGICSSGDPVGRAVQERYLEL